MSTQIHRQMTIEHILSLFPHKAQRLSQEITNAGLHCVGCQAATWETLEAGMYSHGMDDTAINRLVERLNALLDEEIDLTTISITKRAATKYLEILAEEGKQGHPHEGEAEKENFVGQQRPFLTTAPGENRHAGHHRAAKVNDGQG